MLFFEGNVPSHSYAMEWRPCARFPQFEVSEYGDLRAIFASRYRAIGQRVPAYISPVGGYIIYSIPDATGTYRSVHAYRLVAEAFLGPPPAADYEVAHRGGSKLSAYWRDLRWSTRVDNHADRVLHGTAPKGRKNGRAKLTDAQALEARKAFREIKKKPRRSARKELLALAAKYDITENALYMLGDGYTWKHLPDDEFD